MTIQNLYTQYLDGKITQSKFLYEARRDQNLDMISSSNSFDDVVKILKNKSIISEKAHNEAKKAEGKQEVEVISKTIDMVNPYEYTRGMNYELEIMDIPTSEGDLSEENMLKAQKKVLANLTKNSQYYGEKMHGKGEVGHEWIEATKKEIEKIGKGKSKMIREGLEEAADTEADKDMVRKLMAMYKSEPSKFEKLHKQAQTQASTTKDIKFKHILSLMNRAKAGGAEMDEVFKGGFVSRGAILKALKDVGNESEIRQYLTSLEKSGDKFETTDDYIEDFRNYIADKSLEEHGQYASRVADVNADSTPLKEKQEAIYKKYAEQTGIPMENLMSMVREAKAKKIEEDTFLGKDSIDDLKKHPKYSTLAPDGKKNAEDELKKGGSVTIG